MISLANRETLSGLELQVLYMEILCKPWNQFSPVGKGKHGCELDRTLGLSAVTY